MPSKIPCSVILQRIKTEQAGFRQEHSCVDQIATLRIIVEQTIEWQTSLCMNFIDFEKAFDSIDRLVLWKIRKHYGIPQKIISIIQQLYGNICARYLIYLEGPVQSLISELNRLQRADRKFSCLVSIQSR